MTKDSSKNKTNKRVTLVDVARDAGVSRATASLVLRNSPLPAEETRQRVLKSMKKLGYVYNRNAARMRTSQSFSIGVIVLDITNPFFAELTIGAEGYLEQSGYVALLANTSDTADKQSRALETVREHGVDGVLLCPARGTSIDEIDQLQSQLPVVLFVRSLPEIDIDYVGSANEKGVELAVTHLLDHGHQRIAYIGGPQSSSIRQERELGYRQTLTQHRIEVDETLLVNTPVTRDGGFNAVKDLLEMPSPPTAAVCYNDVVAFGVMLGLQAAGRNPGEDFGVVGFDNIADAATWPPALTTISGDPRVIGETAVTRLIERIKNPDLAPEQIILPSTLVVRNSCGSH